MKENLKLKKFLYWIPTLIVMSVIFYFSSRTGTESNSQSDPIVFSILKFLNLNENVRLFITFIVRKAGHISEYVLLSLCVNYAVEYSFEFSNIKKIFLTFFISYVYALSDEFHQLFVVGRSGKFSDTLIDSLGIILGIILFLVIKKWLIKISHSR